MPIASLPQELLDNIFSRLPPTDLHALTLTSSTVYYSAQRHLYADIDLGFKYKNPLVILLLANNESLARCVRNFRIKLDQTPPIFAPFLDSLSLALSHMTGLQTLELDLLPEMFSALDHPVLEHTIFPHLRYLKTQLPFDASVVNFLSKAPGLTTLSVDYIPAPEQKPPVPFVPSSSVPLLAHLEAPQHVALALVPGRPLAHIQLHDADLTEDIVKTLACTSGNLSYLSGSTSALPLDILRAISKVMTKLNFLQLVSTKNHLDTPDRSFFLEVADVLCDIHDLMAINFCGMQWDSSIHSSTQKISETEERRVWTNVVPPLTTTVSNDTDGSQMYFAY